MIPLIYRNDLANLTKFVYDENDYEFNEVLILKKIASFLVSIATTEEPS